MNKRYRFRNPQSLTLMCSTLFAASIILASTHYLHVSIRADDPFAGVHSVIWVVFISLGLLVFGLGIWLFFDWLNGGLILSENEIASVNMLGRIRARIPYDKVTQFLPPKEYPSERMSYTVVGDGKRISIPELTPHFYALRTEILERVNGKGKERNSVARPETVLASYRVHSPWQMVVFAALTFGIICLVLMSLWIDHVSAQGRPAMFLNLAWPVGMFVGFLGSAIRQYKHERLVLYEDRIERISSNGELTVVMPFDQIRSFKKSKLWESYDLESAEDRISLPTGSPAMKPLRKLLKSQVPALNPFDAPTLIDSVNF